MSDDPVYQRLLEAAWRRPLSEAEQSELKAWLQAHPEMQNDWEAERALSQELARLPHAPVPSNFTAAVLRAVELGRAAEQRKQARPRSGWRIHLPLYIRLATASLVVFTTLIAYHHSQVVERRDIAQSLSLVANVSSLPNPKILQDFDAIAAINTTPAPDEELLTLFQ